MLPHLVARLIDHRPGPKRLRGSRPQKASVIAAHEAELLAFWHCCCRQVPGSCQRPDLGLLEATEREPRSGELPLRQRPEEVALIFRLVASSQQTQPPRPRVRGDARVVAGGHRVYIPGQGAVQEGAKFDLAVAHDARAWGPPGRVLTSKVNDDALTEFSLVIQEIVGDSKRPGHLPRHPGGGG